MLENKNIRIKMPKIFQISLKRRGNQKNYLQKVLIIYITKNSIKRFQKLWTR